MFDVIDESQIRPWLKVWFREMRTRAKLSQQAAAERAAVSIGTVRTTEQTGRLPELPGFLSLVAVYRAEGDLVNQIREWRAAHGQAVGGNEDAPAGENVRRRGPIKPAPVSKFTAIPRSKKRKAK